VPILKLNADGHSLYFNAKITDEITFLTLYPFTFCSLLYNTFLLQEYVDIESHSNFVLKVPLNKHFLTLLTQTKHQIIINPRIKF
jgi:hypothetical protein